MTWGTGKLPDDWQKPDFSKMEWVTGEPPDRSGMYQYLVAIMAPHDPLPTYFRWIG